MANNQQIIIYTLEECPNCEILKQYLDDHGAAYEVRNMMNAESLTELRINGIFVREAPVMQKERRFLTSVDLFSHGMINQDAVASLIKGE